MMSDQIGNAVTMPTCPITARAAKKIPTQRAQSFAANRANPVRTWIPPTIRAAQPHSLRSRTSAPLPPTMTLVSSMIAARSYPVAYQAEVCSNVNPREPGARGFWPDTIGP